MEIQVNNSATTDDDCVQLKCDHPASRHTVPCRIRVTGAAAGATDVVLSNPDGRLRFPGVADRSTTLSVPADGSWVGFDVSGEMGSAALNDAVIEAHCRTATGGVVATKAMTVFWFDDERTGITVGGTYTMVGTRYTTTGGHAVSYAARARIRPAGVNCAAPQVAELKVGIMQNAVNALMEIIWNTPTIAWAAGVAPGTVVTVPAKIHQTLTLPSQSNDVAASVDPLYDQPGKADTLDPNSLKPPMGCTGGAAATSFDTPSSPAPAVFSLPATTAAGAAAGTVTYRLERVKITASFITWTTLFNTRNNEHCVHRQRGWAVNVDSTVAGGQATTDAADAAPSSNPVLVPTANDVFNAPANSFTGAMGAATTNFTR